MNDEVKVCAFDGSLGQFINSSDNFLRDRSFLAILKGFAEIYLILIRHLQNDRKNAQINSCKIQIGF